MIIIERLGIRNMLQSYLKQWHHMDATTNYKQTAQYLFDHHWFCILTGHGGLVKLVFLCTSSL